MEAALHRKLFWLAALFVVIAVAGYWAYYAYSPPAGVEPKGAEEITAWAGLITAVAGLVGAVTSLLGGIAKLRHPAEGGK